MNTKYAITVATAVLGVMAASQAQVQISQDGRPERIFRPAKGLVGWDLKFVKQASIANNFEILLGKLGQEKGSSAWVKEFAQEMVTDHTLAQSEAGQLAEQKGITLSGELPSELQAKLNHLRNLSGDAFDQEFRATQKAGHEQVIHQYKAEIENGHDDDVKAVAVKELPVVELHYKMALTKTTMMGPTAANHGQ